jgi:uncharacterized membrane protein
VKIEDYVMCVLKVMCLLTLLSYKITRANLSYLMIAMILKDPIVVNILKGVLIVTVYVKLNGLLTRSCSR